MPGLLRGVARTAVVAGTATAVSNRVSRRQANRWADQNEQQYAQQPQQPQYYEPPPQIRPARASSDRARPDPAAEGARRAEGPGDPDRGGVRRTEGEDPRLVVQRSADALPVSATRDLDAVLAASQPDATGCLQPAAAAAVRIHPARAAGGAHGGSTRSDRRPQGTRRAARFERADRRRVRNGQGAVARPVTSNEHRATTLVRALRAAIARDRQTLRELLTDDVRAWSPALSTASLDELFNELDQRDEAFTDIELDVAPLDVGGDYAVRRVDRRDDAQWYDRHRRRRDRRGIRHPGHVARRHDR